MKAKILTSIKNKYANLGLSEQTMEGVATLLSGFVKEESAVESAVAGAEPMLKQIQSEADKRGASHKTEAERLKFEIAEAKKKLEELSKKNEPPVPPNPDETPQWAKDLVNKVSTLEVGLNNFNSEQKHQNLAQKLTGILSEKKVPESFYSTGLLGRKFADDAEVTAMADSITASYEKFKQEAANHGFNYSEPPQPGNPPANEANEVAQMIAADTKRIVEAQKK